MTANAGKPVIFCDFDGTVTNSDNIIAIMKRFAPPEAEAIKDDILAQRISVREGVGKLFSLLPSGWKDDIVEFVLHHAVIRAGFADFVAYTRQEGIPLYIVSGGIDFFVEPLLGGMISRDRLYCNSADFSGETIRIVWPHACDRQCHNDCGCCKPSIIRRLAGARDCKIVIGDSITDLQAAKLADEVIARDLLLDKCRELKLSHRPFATFHDVIRIVEDISKEVRP